MLHVTSACPMYDRNACAGLREWHKRRYAHQLAKASFGSTHRFPFRVTGPRCTAARPAAVVGVRACVEPRPSRQSVGSESHYSSRHARTCGDMYLILDGPTFERPGPVGD